MYANKDSKGVPATFEILGFIAWKPDPSQVSLYYKYEFNHFYLFII